MRRVLWAADWLRALWRRMDCPSLEVPRSVRMNHTSSICCIEATTGPAVRKYSTHDDGCLALASATSPAAQQVSTSSRAVP